MSNKETKYPMKSWYRIRCCQKYCQGLLRDLFQPQRRLLALIWVYIDSFYLYHALYQLFRKWIFTFKHKMFKFFKTVFFFYCIPPSGIPKMTSSRVNWFCPQFSSWISDSFKIINLAFSKHFLHFQTCTIIFSGTNFLFVL